MSQPFVVDSAAVRSAFPGISVGNILGSGGQKIVFDAIHPLYGHVALKLVRPVPGASQDRAFRELQAAAKLEGSAFARLHDYGQTSVGSDTVLYVLEEFLDGGSLRDLLRSRGRLSVEEALEIAGQLLEALVQVEKLNLVHRDIKPENVMLANGRVVLIDFGIARHLDLESLTQDLAPWGPLTPGYAAPEQIQNQKRAISVRTDIFAIGVLIYEMVTGDNPFRQGCRTAAESLQKGLRFDPPVLSIVLPDIPGPLADFVRRCLRKSSHLRPPSAIEALAEIRRIRALLNP